MDPEQIKVIQDLISQQAESQYDNNPYENAAPDTEVDIFSPETLKLIEESKKNNQTSFQSYWEADENDVSPWSKEQIDQDPAKQLISHAEDGDLDKIKDLFSNKTPIEIQELLRTKDADGYTALHRACYSNFVHVIEYLVSFESNPDMPLVDQLNARTEMGWTPLHSAVYWNNFKSVEYLLNYAHADVNVQTNSGQSCLHLAAQNSNSKETLLLLLTHPSANFYLKNDQGEAAIEIAQRSCKFYALFEMTEDHLNKI